jgi:hypothetical protein
LIEPCEGIEDSCPSSSEYFFDVENPDPDTVWPPGIACHAPVSTQFVKILFHSIVTPGHSVQSPRKTFGRNYKAGLLK